MIRAVIDVNVFLSALLTPHGRPAALLDAWRDGYFDLVVSPLLIAELTAVLGRPRFASIPTTDVVEMMERLSALAILAPDPPAAPQTSRDPGDDYLIALARAHADILVTGDKDLLEPIALGVPTARPSAFLTLIRVEQK